MNTSPAAGSVQRPLLGLRTVPGRLALAVFRMPLRAYRHGLGWMLGRTFLLLVHVGRRTGRPHETVVMVVGDDPTTDELVVCSAWGPAADWVRNLGAGPAAEVRIGRERFLPEHRFLSDEEAFSAAISFRERHPHRLRLLSTVLGWGDPRRDETVRRIVEQHPFVALRPRQSVM